MRAGWLWTSVRRVSVLTVRVQQDILGRRAQVSQMSTTLNDACRENIFDSKSILERGFLQRDVY